MSYRYTWQDIALLQASLREDIKSDYHPSFDTLNDIVKILDNCVDLVAALEEVLNYSAITADFEDDLKAKVYGPGLLRALHQAKQALALATGQPERKDGEP